jgi:hypothetical protein
MVPPAPPGLAAPVLLVDPAATPLALWSPSLAELQPAATSAALSSHAGKTNARAER